LSLKSNHNDSVEKQTRKTKLIKDGMFEN
jgi:hypothetical protein